MPSQIQYYSSSPSVSGILNPQTSQNAIGPIRARDPFPTNTVPRIRPATGFQFRDVSPPRGKPVWNDARTKTDTCTGSLRRFRVSLNHRPVESTLSRRAPFASRTVSASVSGNRFKNEHMDTFPQYSPLNDPHLFDYYARRFGLQVTPRPPLSAKRPKSAPLDRFQGSQASITRSGSVTGGKVLYKVTVKTGDKKNAGTDAKVYLRMKGLKGKFNKKRLFKSSGSDKYAETSTFQFSRGSCHTFKVYGPEIGDIKNIILEHDGLEKQQAWYVEELSVINTVRDKSWCFPCKSWLSLFHTDCQLSRTFTPAGKTDLALAGKTHPKSTGWSGLNIISKRLCIGILL